MPPNKIGGKNYKKGKHDTDEPVMFDRQPDQMYGRVIRLMGGCNVLVYCNDNRERLCHIRGSMRKKTWISVGDIVLISVRDLSRHGESDAMRGDICARYDPRTIYRLQEKDKTINEKLFTIIEKTDTIGSGKTSRIPDDGFGFVFERDENQVMDDDNEEDKSEPDEAMKPINRAAQKRNMMIIDNDEDIDIDNI
jgi:translation initiation factor 1A